MKLILLTVAALVVAAPASAQMSTTTCMAGGPMVTCNTFAPAPASVVDSGPNPGAVAVGTVIGVLIGKAIRAHRERARAAEAAQFDTHIADMVGAGQCDAAKLYALKAGRLDMAEAVPRICTPAN
jgi:hypothetical protein